MSKILKVVGASWMQTKISSYVLGLLGILAILALFAGQMERIQEDGNYAATVFYSEKTGYRIEYWGQSNDLDDIPKGVARAYFRMDISTTGWSLLEVETDGDYPDEIQAYAAGIVEGALTWYLIHTHLENTIRAKCEGQDTVKHCNKLRDALDRSVNIWKSYAAERGASEPFWHHVSLYYTQISGIFTGWKHGVERSTNKYDTDISDLYWLNSAADVIEIQHKMNISVDQSVFDHLPSLSSALLRITNETADDGTATKKLYVAQNVAGSYASMTRVLKKYKLNYHKTSKDPDPAPGISLEFSGYPGSITSQDEFYVIRGHKHRMVVTGTTLRNYNNKLWKDVNITEQVPVAPRVSAANRLASNVSSWGHILAASNSGTACKQWLVVDYAQFERLHTNSETFPKTDKKEIITEITLNKNVKHTIIHRAGNGRSKGLVWLIEQIPGRTQSADISSAFLEKTYWATYGLPFFKDVAEITHVTKMEATYGKIFSEVESPRATIFKLGYKNATSLENIIKLMRQNNLTLINRDNNETNCMNATDCVLKDNGYWSVLGVRGDIVHDHKEAYGVIDTKIVTEAVNSNDLELIAISSPPFIEPPQINRTDISINKGNIASIYTDQFDDEPTINGLKIRDLIKQQSEQKSLDLLNKDVLTPFQWSGSVFENKSHEGLPDNWAFGPFTPKWSW